MRKTMNAAAVLVPSRASGGWSQQITTVTLVIAAIVCLTAAPVSAQDRQDAQDRRTAPERQAERGPNVVIIFSDDES